MPNGALQSSHGLLFLKLSLDSGMPVAEVAGFLDRNEKEVQEKAEERRRVVA